MSDDEPTDPNNLQPEAYKGTNGPPPPPLTEHALESEAETAFRDWQIAWVLQESRAGRLAGYTGDKFQEAAFIAGYNAARQHDRTDA